VADEHSINRRRGMHDCTHQGCTVSMQHCSFMVRRAAPVKAALLLRQTRELLSARTSA
jgi:Rieske Fe-S protein